MNARDSCILPRSYNERYLIGSVFNFFFWQHYYWNNFSLSDPRRYNECYLNGSVFIYLFFSGSIIGVVQMVNKKSGVFTASGDYLNGLSWLLENLVWSDLIRVELRP